MSRLYADRIHGLKFPKFNYPLQHSVPLKCQDATEPRLFSDNYKIKLGICGTFYDFSLVPFLSDISVTCWLFSIVFGTITMGICRSEGLAWACMRTDRTDFFKIIYATHTYEGYT